MSGLTELELRAGDGAAWQGWAGCIVADSGCQSSSAHPSRFCQVNTFQRACGIPTNLGVPPQVFRV